MSRKIAVLIAASVLFFSTAAVAHRIDEYLQATILSLESNRVQASMRLIPGVLVSPSVIASIDTDGDGIFSESEQRAYAQRVLGDLAVTIDGKSVQPKLISWSFPEPAEMRGGLGEIHVDYSVDVPLGGQTRSLILANHHLSRTSVYLMNVLVPQDPALRIVAQNRNEEQSRYELDYQQSAATAAGPRTPLARVRLWLNGFQLPSLLQPSLFQPSLFHLGMRHIAEGTDHLLFLLVLLLPAPLLVSGARWGTPISVRQSLLRILGIVTAFTIGHSITVALAVLGAIHVPSRPVEVMVAVSILVSAVHAFRPIFPGKEALIAGFFGLIHGLAFAATLDRLGLGRWERVAGILAFNLGIETMQMIIVAAVLPSLLLLSRTSVYRVLRISGAAVCGAASLGWVVERLLGVETPVDAILNALARHAVLIAAGLFLVALACRVRFNSVPRRTVETPVTSGAPFFT